MLTCLITVIALVLTTVLPVYPDGITVPIALFLAVVAIGAGLGVFTRAARRDLTLLSPWVPAVLLATLVGALHGHDSRQAMEDALPYVLFMLGLIAGRGLRYPRLVLHIALLVCLIDSVVSILKMPSFHWGVRSTYTYHKITAGLPIIGLFLVTFLRRTNTSHAARWVWGQLWFVICVTCLGAGVLFTVSRGMLLACVLSVTSNSYVRRPSRSVLILLVVIVVAIVYASTFQQLGHEYFRFGQSGTVDGRVREVEHAWLVFVEYPFFGDGLGAAFEIDGRYNSYVHNTIAYHLWKFGLVGSLLLSLPLLALARDLRRSSLELRALAIAGAVGVLAYQVTCAAYKTYYLVWIIGIVVGATRTCLDVLSLRERNRPHETRHRLHGHESNTK